MVYDSEEQSRHNCPPGARTPGARGDSAVLPRIGKFLFTRVRFLLASYALACLVFIGPLPGHAQQLPLLAKASQVLHM
jgi:hypothetical protein